MVDTTGAAPVLTGLGKANDSLVGRIALFDLAFGSAPEVNQNPLFGNLRIDDVAVTLTDEAAAALNDAFGVIAFEEGIPIGRRASIRSSTSRIRTDRYIVCAQDAGASRRHFFGSTQARRCPSRMTIELGAL